MSERDTLVWIKKNLGPIISVAIEGTPFTEDWIACIAMREVGFLLQRYIPKNDRLETIAPLMRGDYSQREGEFEKQYHGFSFWQIDIKSFPGFIKSGNWKDPLKSCQMAVAILMAKRSFFVHKQGIDVDRATTAAYNCGEGSVLKVIAEGKDIDARTFNHDYSKEVWRYREIYKTI